MDEISDSNSDELDEFEQSVGDDDKHGSGNRKGGTTYVNKPYDEAFEISQDLSMAESFDGRDKFDRERKLRNDKYDEAIEISQSMDQQASPKQFSPKMDMDDYKESKLLNNNNGDNNKSLSVLNKPFDEEVDFSGSEESVDTVSERNKKNSINESKHLQSESKRISQPLMTSLAPQETLLSSQAQVKPEKLPEKTRAKDDDDESSEEGDEGDAEESYDNIEGAYNAKDYQSLNVTTEVRDLFQYIERYKPQEVELDTTLKCFIPEYIPAIGEMDAYIKVPRPDGKEDDLGLKILDEPSAQQSDPTVLELQLRAMSKKLQYGDVVVRSIENASKNPVAIEKWIQSIADLHRSKPPPQVHYRRNMPEIEELMNVWPEDFEQALESLHLPSPDLDLSLAEYSKALCTVLDIPTYENPIESLHVMFTLYTDFRNNPHFQARIAGDGADNSNNQFGGADVIEINQGESK
jgi:intraflagellar transport protein 46